MTEHSAPGEGGAPAASLLGLARAQVDYVGVLARRAEADPAGAVAGQVGPRQRAALDAARAYALVSLAESVSAGMGVLAAVAETLERLVAEVSVPRAEARGVGGGLARPGGPR